MTLLIVAETVILSQGGFESDSNHMDFVIWEGNVNDYDVQFADQPQNVDILVDRFLPEIETNGQTVININLINTDKTHAKFGGLYWLIECNDERMVA